MWVGGVVEDVCWAFIDQKWKDSLNVGVAEPAGWDQGADYRKGQRVPRGEKGKD
jgi:hypothetical protein